MSENAELWSWPGYENERRTLKNWLRSHNISYSEEMNNEELRQLYIDVECGKYKE